LIRKGERKDLKCNFQWLSMQRWQFPFPNGTQEKSVWVLNDALFQLWLLYWSDLRISTAGELKEIILNQETRQFDFIFHIKVSGVPLWVGHCHLYMEGHLNLHLTGGDPGDKAGEGGYEGDGEGGGRERIIKKYRTRIEVYCD